MRIYELVVILRSSLSEAARKKTIDTIKNWLKDMKVEVNDWGQKGFSYPIKHEETGYYVQFVVETETSIPQDVDKRLITSDDVVRHLIVRKK